MGKKDALYLGGRHLDGEIRTFENINGVVRTHGKVVSDQFNSLGTTIVSIVTHLKRDR